MKCVTSYCNPTLLRKNLTRFWPIWALYTLIWAYALPVNCFMVRQQEWRTTPPLERVREFTRSIPDLLSFGLFLAFTFGVLTAMAMFSYLYNNRSAGLFHSLPLRREGLFLTGYVSGLLCLLVPNALIWLATVGAEALCGHVDLYTITLWLLAQSALCLFFYSFAVFCAMFTGHLLALPAFYGILNFLVIALTSLLETLCRPFLYGYAGLPTWLERLVLWLTPVANLGDGLRWSVTGAEGVYTCRFSGGHLLWIYALAGLALAALALLVYRRRHVESAGDLVSIPFVRPVFLYGFALCVGLFFGYWLYAVFGYEAPGGLTGSLILWTVIGYFAAQMLLKKSFRVFRAWKGCAVLVAVVALGVIALRTDLTGFEGRVPQPGDVVYITVDGMGSYPYDSGRSFSFESYDRGLIQKTTELHRAFVSEHKDPWPGDRKRQEYMRLHVTYHLTNGTTLTRDYGQSVPLDSPFAQAAEAFYCDPALVRQSYRIERMEPQDLLSAEVSSLFDPQAKGTANWDLWDQDLSGTGYSTRHAALLALYDAVRADFEQGSLGKRYLDNTDPERQQNTYTTDVTLYFGPRATQTQPLYGEVAYDKVHSGYDYRYSVSFTLTPQAENTLSVLEKLGVFSPTRTLRPYGVLVPEQERIPELILNPNSSGPVSFAGL